jgi:hypothetical protein
MSKLGMHFPASKIFKYLCSKYGGAQLPASDDILLKTKLFGK